MSTRKYRLAAPIDDDNATGLYRSALSTVPLLQPRFTKANDAKLSSRSVPLDNTKTVEKVSSNSPPRWWLVLPCLLLITLVSASDGLLMNDLIVRRYKLYYGLSGSAEAQRVACRQATTTTSTPAMQMPYWQMSYWQIPSLDQNSLQQHPAYSLVQRKAADFNVKNSIATLIPSVITFILLGSNSDLVGRRPLIILPFIGKVLRYTLMLIIVSLNLSDAWIISTHALEAIFGSGGLIMISALAYITDCTDKTRTRAFLVTEVMVVVARIIPLLAVGIWLRRYLYTVPLSVDLVLSVIGLLYALFVQPESVESVKHISFLRQLARVRLKPILRTITVFAVKRSGSKRQQIILLTIVTILLLFILYGYYSVFILYLYGQPFCLDAFNVGLLSLAQALTIFAMSLVIILFKKILNDTYILPIIGSLAFIIGLLMFSIAKKLWLLYIAACIGSLFFVALPVLRTKITQLVEINEYAVIFITAGIVETIGHEAVGAMANGIYNASIKFFPGLVFLVFAIIGVFPILIMIYLILLEIKESRNAKTKSVENSNGKSRPTPTRRLLKI